jgi:hypothetical protein
MNRFYFTVLFFYFFCTLLNAQSGYWQGSGSHIYYSAGKVGIGTSAPTGNLHVYGAENPNFILQGPTTRLEMGVATCNGCYASFARTGDLVYRAFGGTKHGLIFYLPNDDKNGESYIKFGDDANGGWVSIFNNKTMRVDGQLFAKEIKIQTNVWSDRVFGDDYRLPSLNEVKQHIAENSHLPGIPSEAEVKENGIDLGEMQAKLLQKIEELTLYAIRQQEVIDKLHARIEQLEKK